MSLFNNFFQRNNERQMLLESINYNIESISKSEGRSRKDSEYLAICTLLTDLSSRTNGQSGWKLTMDILQKELNEHHTDVLMFLTWKAGKYHFKQEAEQEIINRHEVKDFTIDKEKAISLLITMISRNAILQLSHFLKHTKDALGEEFQIISEKEVSLNLITALISYELQIINNLECEDNAKKLNVEVKKQVFEKFGESALNLLHFYENSYLRGIQAAIKASQNAKDKQAVAQMEETDKGIPGNFIRNILGPNIRSFTFQSESGEHIRLYLAINTSSFLISQLGTWKKIRAHHSRINFNS